jgi:cytochrome c peroxidase
MFTLTDDRLADQNDAELKRQKAHADKQRPFRDNDLANRKVYIFERRLTSLAPPQARFDKAGK